MLLSQCAHSLKIVGLARGIIPDRHLQPENIQLGSHIYDIYGHQTSEQKILEYQNYIYIIYNTYNKLYSTYTLADKFLFITYIVNSMTTTNFIRFINIINF